MSVEIEHLAACLGASEKSPSVTKVLSALGIKKVPPPKKETWKSRFAPKPVSVLDGYAKLAAPSHGVTIELDFPATRDGMTERPVTYKGPRKVIRITLDDGFEGPILLDWSMADSLDRLRAEAKARGKAYAKGTGKTPDSIRIGKVGFVIHRKSGNKRAARVELSR